MTYTVIAEIAKALGKHRTSINRRAIKEQWPFFEETVIGGPEKRFPIDNLPKAIQLAVIAFRQQAQVRPNQIDTDTPDDGNTNVPAVAKPLPSSALSKKEIDNAGLKASLLSHYNKVLASAPWGEKVKSRDDFITAYNSGISWPHLLEALGPLSWKTLDDWALKVKKSGNDCFQLADRRGRHLRGKCSLTEEQTEIFLRSVLRPGQLVSEAYRVAKAVMKVKGFEHIPSEDTFRRWLKRWRSRNYDVWVWAKEGKAAWNDKCAMYIERDYNLISVGDVVVADGHSLNFEIINPWTGKPTNHMTLILFYDMKSNMPLGWEIMPTENTAAISSALRRAVIRLGKYPKVVYLDNGRAFKSKYFKGSQDFDEAGYAGLYKRMNGCQTIFAWPYHGQSKTVERFFRTFAELERLSPTHTGTSIENKPPRMKRGEKKHIALHEQQFGGRCLTLEETHIAIATWFDIYAKRPQRGHLDGDCPMDVFMAGKGPGVDQAELAWMMMSIDEKTPGRNGIYFLKEYYYHPALIGRRGAVTVRYDIQDKSSLWVFEQDGTFICEARPHEKLHPAAAQLGNEEDKAKLRLYIEQKNHQEKIATASATELLRNVVLPEHNRQMAELGITEKQTTGQVNKMLPASDKVVSFDAEKIAREVAEMAVWQKEAEERYFRDSLLKLDESDRYDRLLELTAQGIELGPEWTGFMAFFEQTPEHDRFAEHWESRRIAYGMMYRSVAQSG